MCCCCTLQEKDDANFKLMSERIKSNSMYKLLVEEKELLQSQLSGMLTEKQRSGVRFCLPCPSLHVCVQTWGAGRTTGGEGQKH